MILDDIVAARRRELVQTRELVPLDEIEKRIAVQRPPLDFAAALRDKGVSIIAEVKKASPSRGLLCPDFDHMRLAKTYAASEAAAVSVLTESRYFQGSLEHLREIRVTPGLERMPLLRKDFLFDEYQVYESRAAGADAILLIVALLEDKQLGELMALASAMDMACLVEAHDENEVNRALESGARLVGINNRDLRTFEVNIGTTERLRPLVPPECVAVSESGISTTKAIGKLRDWGVDAALVGEALVTAGDVSARLAGLVRAGSGEVEVGN